MEVLATGVTSELPLFVVRGKMKGEMGRGDESLVAQAAAVRIQADAPVRTSTIGGAAASLAGWTLGRAVCFVHRLLLLLLRRG